MTKLMKIKRLKNYGIPSYILNIWEKHYSSYLLPVQEDAVINYGILDYNQGSDEIAAFSSKAYDNIGIHIHHIYLQMGEGMCKVCG